MKSQFRKRFESFLWRSLGLSIASFLTFIVSPETIIALAQSGIVMPAIVIAVIGLITSEITKLLNK